MSADQPLYYHTSKLQLPKAPSLKTKTCPNAALSCMHLHSENFYFLSHLAVFKNQIIKWTLLSPFRLSLCGDTHVRSLMAFTRFSSMCLMRFSLSCFQTPLCHSSKSHFIPNTCKSSLIPTAPWLFRQGTEQPLRRPSLLQLFGVSQFVSK